MRSVILAAAASVLALGLSGGALARDDARPHYAPRNACEGHAPSAAFRRQLAMAVANRDSTLLKPLVSDDTLLDFGGGAGWAELQPRLDDEHYRLWDELDELMRLGCSVKADGMLIMPWIWSQPVDEVDGMEGMLVTGEGVPLRAAPSDDGRILATLTWNAVQLADGWDPEAEYLKVFLPGGPTGYVRQDALRSLISYRLLAEADAGGTWKITAFVAGD